VPERDLRQVLETLVWSEQRLWTKAVLRRGPPVPSVLPRGENQGLGGQIILPPANLNRSGTIVCRERLGGILRFYRRKAA
jgi:hypothetical protein